MGYELQAVIADAELLHIVSGDLARQARPVPLRQGLALLPLTGELYDAVTA